MDKFLNVQDNSACSNVYRCGQASYDFLEFSKVCDGREDCGEESSVCWAARLTTVPFTSLKTYKNRILTFYCLPGMKHLELLATPCMEETFHNLDYPSFGVKAQTVVFPNIKIDCRFVFGELNLYLSCMDKCANSSCPLTHVTHDSCTEISRGKTLTLAKNKYLTLAIKGQGGYHNNVFVCSNGKCVNYEKVCNLVNDCGDHSDEKRCTNSFQCSSTKDYISRTKKCDGQINCLDFSDECNTECSKEIISGNFLKVSAWIIGLVGVFLNFGLLIKGICQPWKKGTIVRMNRIFTNMIHIGDFLTGLYILLIILADTLYSSGTYCKEQFVWLTSQYCAGLGVISTLGANISMFSMAYLSIFRATSFKKQRTNFIKNLKSRATIVLATIIFSSACIAIFPLINEFEDFFVNGLVYDDKIRLFIAKATMKNHVDVINAYFGKTLNYRLTWKQINRLVNMMFTNNYGEIQKEKIHFYGNDGVCLFKFFVKKSDPQKAFVWVILAINLSCFVVISVCYLNIIFGSNRTSSSIQLVTKTAVVKIRKRNTRTEKLQRNITVIILTDFLCWIPFIFICVLHSFEVIDATFLYSITSVVVLPINSVINPILYDNTLRKKGSKIKNFFNTIVTPPH